jgi:hypothetical protein
MNKTVNNVAVRTNGRIIHDGNSGMEGLGLMLGDNVGVGDGVGLEVVVGLGDVIELLIGSING